MKNDDTVFVHPHGKPDQAARAKVVLISANQRSICVAFESKPPFAIVPDGWMVHPEHGIVMLAMREKVGPWVEVIHGGHYEIEEV